MTSVVPSTVSVQPTEKSRSMSSFTVSQQGRSRKMNLGTNLIALRLKTSRNRRIGTAGSRGPLFLVPHSATVHVRSWFRYLLGFLQATYYSAALPWEEALELAASLCVG